MGDVGCCKTMEVLNFLFDDRVMGPMTADILARLKTNEPVGPIVGEIGDRFQLLRGKTKSAEVIRIIEHWPTSQVEMIRGTVVWALTQRLNGIPMKFHWRGDDEYPETLTRIEVRDNDVIIEFLHPPVLATVNA